MDSPRKIVVAVDQTQPSHIAFVWALHHLIKKTDHVIFLNSVPSLGLDFPSPDLATEYLVLPVPSGSSAEAAERIVTEESKALVNTFMDQCKQAGVSCEGEVLKGEPAGSWIVEEANRLSADLVVIGSHDTGVIKRTFLGSIGDYVLHNAACPVAIVRQAEACYISDPLKSSEHSRKIVIAVDESKEAINAFTWTLQNFCTLSDKVIIYHVCHPAATPVTAVGTGAFGMEEVYMPPDISDEAEVQALNSSEKLVEKYMAYVSRESKISCEGMIVRGQTEAKVCEGLKALKADAVVVGSHNRGAIARTFLGSVSDYLAHNSPCPLIVVKMATNAELKFEDDIHKHLL